MSTEEEKQTNRVTTNMFENTKTKNERMKKGESEIIPTFIYQLQKEYNIHVLKNFIP
jgi:hypothetical protein